ncbi:hypothetical protein FRX31_019811 [Thalictrum thalictroides]|uniref:Endonuclease/exonuclease/phosphatase domain-containing protein n=1 Tax=Thalictrum thalictroides TaxID=46969 RepID=A0A7J6W242_THATH|nr:hypothetical protein FRX31_019811 [Thalictrum thalictroides]
MNTPGVPWVIAVDFNAHIFVDERKGGRTPSSTAIQNFRDFIDGNYLSEAHSTGLQYTWSNRQQGARKILSKIDRILANQEWMQKFMGWTYKVLSRVGSDHSPLIGWHTHIPKPENAPFRFVKAWTSSHA